MINNVTNVYGPESLHYQRAPWKRGKCQGFFSCFCLFSSFIYLIYLMNWFLVPFQVFNTILGTDTLPVIGMRSSARALISGQSWKKRTKETRTLAHPFPSATLSRHFFFSQKKSPVDFKGSSAFREIILVGSRGGMGRAGRKGWSLCVGRDGGQTGTSPLFQDHLSCGATPSGENSGLHLARGATVRTQKSGLVFAGRKVRFGLGRGEWLLVVPATAS